MRRATTRSSSRSGSGTSRWRTGSSARASRAASTTTTAPGTQTRINWELRFARGGVGAIVSAWCGVDRARADRPRATRRSSATTAIPFWRELGERVHEHGCEYILQLAHGGRQRDIPGIEFRKGLSSTGKSDPLHGFEAERATPAQLREIAGAFAAAARARPRGGPRRRRDPRRERLPVHAVPLLGDQRPQGRVRRLAREPRAPAARDGAGGPGEVGDDFHLQVKISATEHANAFLFWLRRGNTIDGLGPGVPLARGGRRGRDPRLGREHVPASR